MKKMLSFLIAIIFLFSSTSVLAQNNITVVFDGQKLISPIAPQIVNGSTMVPFRTIFSALGMRVEWSEAMKMAYAMDGEKTVIFTIGSAKMRVQTEIIQLPVAPYILNGHTMVPVRVVCRALGCDVDWNDFSREVIIKTPGYIEPSYTPVIDPTPAYTNKNESNYSAKLVELINYERTINGLEALKIDNEIAEVALSHSTDMAICDYIDHVSQSGLNLDDRLTNAGIYYDYAAENIASGFLNPQEVVQSWMNSPSHRDIILRTEFTHIGVGYYAGGSNGTYWTLVLVGR
ncbi:MAG: hypothetical protein E7395_03735 [Ruminococcaceae bacterium]|nr:hypothetical protein [Oscillospiraceae bacterium]